MFKSILGKLIARGLSIILSSLFAIAMAFFGPTGCSLTPNIYKMPGDELEEIRSSVGSIGVTISSYPVKQKIVKPAKGVIGGARQIDGRQASDEGGTDEGGDGLNTVLLGHGHLLKSRSVI